MKSIYFFFLFTLVCNQINSQVLKEQDFSRNGRSTSGILFCESKSILKVELSSKFGKNTYSTLKIKSFIPEIQGYTISQKPDQMNSINANNTDFAWTPLVDFKDGDKYKLILIPILKSDTITLPCTTFEIELPLQRDLPPKVLISEYTLQIPVNGQTTTKEYALVASAKGENLGIFEHDDSEPVSVVWITRNAKFSDSQSNSGRILFKHNGPAPQAPTNQFSVEFLLEDHLKQRSEKAVLHCMLVPDHGNSKPKWSLVNSQNSIHWSETIYEGEEVIIKPFKAINPADGKPCDIEVLEIIPGAFSISNDLLSWTPSYDVVPDSKGENSETVTLKFEAKSSAGVTSKCDVIFEVVNRSKPQDEDNYKKAIENFNTSENEFVEIVATPLCYIRHASMLVTKNNDDYQSILQTTSKLNDALSISSMSNPVALGVYTGVGILVNELQGLGKKKAKILADKTLELAKEIQKYRDIESKFIEAQNSLSDYKTKTECDKLLDLSLKLATEVQSLKISITDYTSVGKIFNKKKERRIQESCIVSMTSN